ncbi:hypothetical protein G8764_16815 [Pseudomaricurvus alcaniphilus]|uniref:hypothetical protein n=1 Tax=Pseudomaricurvus alcaniphilus TaxID=1166482 RepID=UPI00140D2929|nr:hypothetical protein [Pseudomaricurvus alcaniphilus]NHN38973.1 hypothetical protein [Pseudomaricurvus alcaniphilus]
MARLFSIFVLLSSLSVMAMSGKPSEPAFSQKVFLKQGVLLDEEIVLKDDAYYEVTMYFYKVESSDRKKWSAQLPARIYVYDSASNLNYSSVVKELNMDQGYLGESVLAFHTNDFKRTDSLRLKVEIVNLDDDIRRRFSEVQIIIKELRSTFFD